MTPAGPGSEHTTTVDALRAIAEYHGHVAAALGRMMEIAFRPTTTWSDDDLDFLETEVGSMSAGALGAILTEMRRARRAAEDG